MAENFEKRPYQNGPAHLFGGESRKRGLNQNAFRKALTFQALRLEPGRKK